MKTRIVLHIRLVLMATLTIKASAFGLTLIVGVDADDYVRHRAILSQASPEQWLIGVFDRHKKKAERLQFATFRPSLHKRLILCNQNLLHLTG